MLAAKEKLRCARSTGQRALGTHGSPYVQPRRLQCQLRDTDSHLVQPRCSWGTRVGTALPLHGILGRLVFHWPYKNPCADTSPTGNIWCTEGTDPAARGQEEAPSLTQPCASLFELKIKSPVSHRGLRDTEFKRTECFWSHQLSDFPRDLSLLFYGAARNLAEQSRREGYPAAPREGGHGEVHLSRLWDTHTDSASQGQLLGVRGGLLGLVQERGEAESKREQFSGEVLIGRGREIVSPQGMGLKPGEPGRFRGGTRVCPTH